MSPVVPRRGQTHGRQSAKKDRQKKKRRPTEIYLFPEDCMRAPITALFEKKYIPFPFFSSYFYLFFAQFLSRKLVPLAKQREGCVDFVGGGRHKKILPYIWEPAADVLSLSPASTKRGKKLYNLGKIAPSSKCQLPDMASPPPKLSPSFLLPPQPRKPNLTSQRRKKVFPAATAAKKTGHKLLLSGKQPLTHNIATFLFSKKDGKMKNSVAWLLSPL